MKSPFGIAFLSERQKRAFVLAVGQGHSNLHYQTIHIKDVEQVPSVRTLPAIVEGRIRVQIELTTQEAEFSLEQRLIADIQRSFAVRWL